jgi:hypothetical protein
MQGRRDFASNRTLVAARYDVAVTTEAERARTLLAKLDPSG